MSALERAQLIFAAGQPLPVDLYMELTLQGYDPEAIEEEVNEAYADAVREDY